MLDWCYTCTSRVLHTRGHPQPLGTTDPEVRYASAEPSSPELIQTLGSRQAWKSHRTAHHRGAPWHACVMLCAIPLMLLQPAAIHISGRPGQKGSTHAAMCAHTNKEGTGAASHQHCRIASGELPGMGRCSRDALEINRQTQGATPRCMSVLTHMLLLTNVSPPGHNDPTVSTHADPTLAPQPRSQVGGHVLCSVRCQLMMLPLSRCNRKSCCRLHRQANRSTRSPGHHPAEHAMACRRMALP
jgi:hypothetical protein